MPLVSSGVDYGNLRELSLARMKDFGVECRDIRTREVGIREVHSKILPDEVSHVCFKEYRLRYCLVFRLNL